MKKGKKTVIQKPGSRLALSDVKALRIQLQVWWRRVVSVSRQVYLYKTFWLVLLVLLVVGLYAGYVLYSFLFASPQEDVGVVEETVLELEVSRLKNLQMWTAGRERDLDKGVRVPGAVFSP